MTSSVERWVVISDVHVPFHDKRLLPKVQHAIRDLDPQGFIINGDFMDMYSLGSYNADSLGALRNWTLSKEYRIGNGVLDGFDRVIPKGSRKYYLYGNHEDRYFREYNKGDRAKYGTALQAPDDALRLRERGYRVLKNAKQDFVKLGEHLEVTHGIYTPVHVAKKHLDEFQGSVIIGHSHRYQVFVSGQGGAWNCGFLGNPASAGFHYMSRTQRSKWVQSFAVVTISARGDFWVEPVQVHNGSFICHGKGY